MWEVIGRVLRKGKVKRVPGKQHSNDGERTKKRTEPRRSDIPSEPTVCLLGEKRQVRLRYHRHWGSKNEKSCEERKSFSWSLSKTGGGRESLQEKMKDFIFKPLAGAKKRTLGNGRPTKKKKLHAATKTQEEVKKACRQGSQAEKTRP